MTNKSKSVKFQVYMVAFTDDAGQVNYLTNVENWKNPESGSTECSWNWSKDPVDAMLYRKHSKAIGLAHNCTDPNEGPVWYVLTGTLRLNGR